MNRYQTLQLLNELWSDLQDPGVIWEILALVATLLLAFVFSQWWRKRQVNKAGRLQAAGVRVAFPLMALILVAIAREVLSQWMRVNLLAVAIPLFASLAIVRATVYVLRQSFPKATWLGAFERWVATIVWLGLALHITGLAPYVIEFLDRYALTVGKHPITVWMGLKGGLTVIVTVMVALWLAGVIEARLLKLDSFDANLRIVLVRIAKALLTVTALMVGLALVGIDMTALSVFTGALGVGLGFGLQKIASNYVSGFIILLDRSIRMGDLVQVSPETSGIVTEITTRYTVLRNLAGVEFIVPNETLIGTTVQNQSHTDSRVRITVRVGVAYSTKDLPAVISLLESIPTRNPRVLLDPAPKALILAFGDNAIELELGFWIPDPQEGTGGIRSEMHLAIWQAFREHGVEIPFPQREVRLVGEAPAAT